MKMKSKLTIVIILFLLAPLLGLADSAQQLFEKGNALYAKKQYPAAINAYQDLIRQGYHSAALYYNLGNAYYRDNDIAPALLYYHKAQKLEPSDEAININIQFASLKTADKVETEPEFFISRWWHSFILWIPASTLAILSVVFILVASAALIVYLFTGSVWIKKTMFYSAIVLIVLGVSSIFVANRQNNYFDNHHQAIIFGATVNVKGSPADKAKPLFVIHEGTLVGVEDEKDGWLRIKLLNGNEGWIVASDAREI